MSSNRQRLTPVKASQLKPKIQTPTNHVEITKQQYCTLQSPPVDSMNDCVSGCLSLDNTTPKCQYNPSAYTPPSSTIITPHNINYKSLNMDDCVRALAGKVLEIEGNIGCGKSTLTKLMTRTLNNHTQNINEEITVESLSKQDTTTTDIMQMAADNIPSLPFALVHGELVNQTFLAAFYANPAKYGFAFQMYMLTTRLFQMQTASQQAHIQQQCALLDRGAVGDALFALYNHSIGSISDEELGVYKSVCSDRLPPSLSHKIDVVAYLDVSPLECFRRMNSMRQRDAEKEVVPDYIEGIDHAYFELMIKWLGHRADACGGIDVGKPPAFVVLDWSQFGCTKTVIQKLARASMSIDYRKQLAAAHPEMTEEQLHSVIIQPNVTFVKGDSILADIPNYHKSLIISTTEEVKAFYDHIVANGMISHPNTGVQFETLYINWGLPHINEFRRLSMKHISYEGSIVFYNSDHETLM